MGDNLLQQNGPITHHGERLAEDEEMTPSLEKVIVLQWLKLVHKDLPALVKQRYGTELRSETLASIKPEMSQALDSLMDEVKSAEDAWDMRSQAHHLQNININNAGGKSGFGFQGNFKSHHKQSVRACPLYKVIRHDHFLSKCPFLPESGRHYISSGHIIG